MKLHCPICHQLTEVEYDGLGTEIACDLCGSAIPTSQNNEQLDTVLYSSRMCAHFQILELVGQGTFGFVWKAKDTRLDRIVAIKVPRASQLSEAESERFLREAKSAAKLKHPNIVAVHEIGADDGKPYIVSDFIQGVNLRQKLQSKSIAPIAALNLLRKIASALEYAHSQGVVHRDLKPANIMIDLDSVPFVMDFGLAKLQDVDATATLDGTMIGTPAYMSPEQARGKGNTADRRADIYALGVILYELMTGELPFRGDRAMLIYQILTEDPPSPKKLNSKLSDDLCTICLKCLEKQPEKRYQSCQELAVDLDLYAERKPITAKPVRTLGKIWRWYHRSPRAALLAAAGYSLCLMIVMSLWGAVGLVHYFFGIYDSKQPWKAVLEICGFALFFYLPSIVASVQVLNGAYRWILLCNSILALSAIFVVAFALDFVPPLEIFRAAENNDYIRFQLASLLAIMVFLGMVLGLNAQYCLKRVEASDEAF